VIVASRLGEPGFLRFVHELNALGVLDRAELLSWLELHGCVLRATEEPLDDGERFDEEAFSGA
jgi:hypothetical protein